MNIVFNKIYVIQSLNPTKEILTGQELYNDILQYFKVKYPEKDAEIINVDTPVELLETFSKIKNECKTKNIKPIIHLEIHGLKDKTGLGLNNGHISWDDLYEILIEINIASRWNLFITMAVCYGNYAMKLIKPTNSAPFTGILGSFEEIEVEDLYIKFNAFYNELLISLDFEKALEQLYLSNPDLPTDYRYINAEQTFKNVCQLYFDTQFSKKQIEKRVEKALKEAKLEIKDRGLKHNFKSQLRGTILSTKEKKFEEAKTKFFMFDMFPENRDIYCVGWKPI